MRKQRRLVVLGFSMVGKTAICMQFCAQSFSESYEPTYENSYTRVLYHRGQQIDVQLTDTQGQDEQDTFRNEYCLGAHGYVLVFSVASRRTLRSLEAINDKLLNLMGTSQVPRVVVGNKTDLERQVSTTEAQEIAHRWGAAYVECSAKKNQNIDDVFHTALDEVDKSNQEEAAGTPPRWTAICPCLGLVHVPLLVRRHGLVNRFSVTLLMLLTLIVGLMSLGVAVGIGVRPTVSETGDLIAFILFGIGLLTSLVSTLGLVGAKSNNRDFLRVYVLMEVLLLFVEVLVCIFLLPGLLDEDTKPSFFVAVGTAGIVQLVSIYFVFQRQRAMAGFQDAQLHEFDGATSLAYSETYVRLYAGPIN